MEQPQTLGSTCRCPAPWPALIARVTGTHYRVLASDSHGPLSRLYVARCTGCQAPYPGAWRLRTLHAA